MDGSSRRFILRNSTAEQHEALDRQIGPLTSRATYDAYVRGLYAFRAPLETMIASLVGAFGDAEWRPCHIADELKQDISDLGLEALRLVPALAPSTRDEAVGYLYVLEGSAMGARVLVKQAAELGMSAQWGARHLFKQTSAPSDHWRTFVTALDAPGLHTEDMINGARAAFRLAHSAMDRALTHYV